MRHWLSRIVWSFLAYAGAYGAFAEPLCVTEASRRAGEWMQGHPVMQRYAETITYIERMPAEGTGYFVFGVRLTPTGYLILNSDDRLPLVVGTNL